MDYYIKSFQKIQRVLPTSLWRERDGNSFSPIKFVKSFIVERATGIEPASSVWKTEIITIIRRSLIETSVY